MNDNRISILLKNNEELKEALLEAVSGDTFRLTVEGTIISKDEERLIGVIEKVYEEESEEAEEDGDEDGEEMPAKPKKKNDDEGKGNVFGSLAFADRNP